MLTWGPHFGKNLGSNFFISLLLTPKGCDESGESRPAGKDDSFEVALMFFFLHAHVYFDLVGARKIMCVCEDLPPEERRRLKATPLPAHFLVHFSCITKHILYS